jgi:hypothetical protein
MNQASNIIPSARTRMTSRSFVFLITVAILPALCVPRDAFAQRDGDDSTEACDKAAKLVMAYDQSVMHSGGHAAQGNGKQEQRQIAVAQLLGCGATAGKTAAATILGARLLTDTASLVELVGPFGNFLDTAVVSAAMNVAADPSASVPARIYALRTMWVLRTGKYWIGFDRMMPTAAATIARPAALCADGLQVTDATPYWIYGAQPPSGFGAALVALARQLVADQSQPVAVRSAATCAGS